MGPGGHATGHAAIPRERIGLVLPRLELGAPQAIASMAPDVARPATPLTPIPTPIPTPSPAQHGHGHGHGHGHANEHDGACSGHAHAHGAAPVVSHPPMVPTPTGVHAPATSHVDAHSHAHAHAHSHGGEACDGSHGLLDAHHHDWSHLALQPRSRKLLRMALYVQLAFLIMEVIGGIVTNSLALLGDAAHMLADVGALGLALLAARLAAHAVDARRTWGMPRAEVVAAAVNSGVLVISCAWIGWEGVNRLLHPEPIHGSGLIAIAAAGLVANLVGAWLLAQADRENVNIRAAMAHLLVDAASSVGVIVAGIVIAMGGPLAIDAIASLLIAFVAVRGTWPVLRASLDSLVDAAPAAADMNDVARVIGSAPGVTELHDVHVWEPGPRRIAATAHVLVAPGVDIGSAIVELRRMLTDQLGIDHVTLQVATDRRAQLLGIEPVLPRDAAIERAVWIIAGARPGVDAHRIRSCVMDGASYAAPEHRISPVRLAASAMRAL